MLSGNIFNIFYKDNRKNILLIFFLIPYFEINFINKLFTYELFNVTITPSIIIMIIFIIISDLIVRFKKYEMPSNFIKVKKAALIFVLITLIKSIYNNILPITIHNLVWFIIPLLYGLYYATLIFNIMPNYILVLKKSIFLFVFYLYMILLINIRTYNMSFFIKNTENRLISPGGGPVILGYTIVLFLIITIYINEVDNIRYYKFYIISFLFFSLFTGSRGSIIPSIILILISFLKGKKTIKYYLNINLLMMLIILLKPISLIKEYFPRVNKLIGDSRQFTAIDSINVFKNFNLVNKITGYGFGNVFPYKKWLNTQNYAIGFIDYNRFLFNGETLLVQPHNTFIYLLLETGIIGVFVYLYILIKMLLNNKTSKFSNLKIIILFSVFLLNLLDSIFVIQPGSSGLWWMLICIVSIL